MLVTNKANDVSFHRKLLKHLNIVNLFPKNALSRHSSAFSVSSVQLIRAYISSVMPKSLTEFTQIVIVTCATNQMDEKSASTLDGKNMLLRLKVYYPYWIRILTMGILYSCVSN